MQVQKIALNKAISILDSLSCVYAIIDANGNQFGLLKVEQPKTKSARLYPYGEPTNYSKKYLEHIKVGQVVEVPFDKYTSEKLQSYICNYLSKHIGTGNYTSHINKETNCVEVLRIS